MFLSFQQGIEFMKQIHSSLGTRHICELIFYLLGHMRWQSELQQTYPVGPIPKVEVIWAGFDMMIQRSALRQGC